MNKRTLKDLGNIEGKTILVRVDFNVPVKNGEVMDVNRINAALPTINYLIDNKAKVVLFSHLGRVESEEDKAKATLKPVAQKLSEIMNKQVKFVPQTRGAELEDAIKAMNISDVLMFENTRFEDVVNGELVNNESKNNAELGKY